MKLVKLIKQPSKMPDYWNAHGKDTTAEPVIVFQMEKMITMELCFEPGSSIE